MKNLKNTINPTASTSSCKEHSRFLSKMICTLCITAMIATGVLAGPGSLVANGASIDTSLNDNGQPSIEGFTVRAHEGRAFLNWYTQGVTELSVYLILRSGNGVDYTTIGDRKGAASPNDLKILNCYIDTSPLEGVSYYQLIRINTDLSTSESDVFTLITNELQILDLASSN